MSTQDESVHRTDCNLCRNFFIPDPTMAEGEGALNARCTLANGEELFNQLVLGIVRVCPAYQCGRPKGLPQKDRALFPDWLYEGNAVPISSGAPVIQASDDINLVFRDESGNQYPAQVPRAENIGTIVGLLLQRIGLARMGESVEVEVINQRTRQVYRANDSFFATDTVEGDTILLRVCDTSR